MLPTLPTIYNCSSTQVWLQALYAETLMSYEEFNQMFAQFKEHYWKVHKAAVYDFMEKEDFKMKIFQAKAQLPLSLEAFPEVFKRDTFKSICNENKNFSLLKHVFSGVRQSEPTRQREK